MPRRPKSLWVPLVVGFALTGVYLYAAAANIVFLAPWPEGHCRCRDCEFKSEFGMGVQAVRSLLRTGSLGSFAAGAMIYLWWALSRIWRHANRVAYLRSIDPHQCPNCGYDTASIAAAECPECGTNAVAFRKQRTDAERYRDSLLCVLPALVLICVQLMTVSVCGKLNAFPPRNGPIPVGPIDLPLLLLLCGGVMWLLSIPIRRGVVVTPKRGLWVSLGLGLWALVTVMTIATYAETF